MVPAVWMWRSDSLSKVTKGLNHNIYIDKNKCCTKILNIVALTLCTINSILQHVNRCNSTLELPVTGRMKDWWQKVVSFTKNFFFFSFCKCLGEYYRGSPALWIFLISWCLLVFLLLTLYDLYSSISEFTLKSDALHGN